MKRVPILAMALLASLAAAQAQVNSPQLNPTAGAIFAAPSAATSNPLSSLGSSGNQAGASKVNPIIFCSTSGPSVSFIVGAPDCGSDPLSVATSVIPSSSSAIGGT